jgi:hypothetical protein
MRFFGWWIGAIVLSTGIVCRAEDVDGGLLFPSPPAIQWVDPGDCIDPNLFTTDDPALIPLLMALPPSPPSVYAPVEPPKASDGLNQGGLNVDLDFKYLTDDVYRGVSHNRAVYVNIPGQPVQGKLHASNFQPDARLTFDLGGLPHPYVGVLANLNDSDPLSRFQEIRPFAGVTYNLRPLLVDAGVNAYIYPERERFNPSPNTAEVYTKLTLDDSFFTLTPKPILSPYIYGAYDYQRNQGWYLEAGLKHDFDFPDFGLTLTPYADVAYISHFEQQFVSIDPHKSGFQHYDIGLTADYSLNHLFHTRSRYGEFAVEGYLTYTGRFSNQLLAVSEVWGGVGLRYRY